MIERNIIENASLPYLEGLNPEQREAVENTEGPLLVLAGAGTGKTKVLTTRISHILLSRKAFPSQILAVTFTNKAAKEMRHRVENLIGAAVEGLWLGTFHSIAAKILRRHAKEVGLKSDFTIIDFDDQLRLVKQIFSDFNIDSERYSPKSFLYLLSRLKDRGVLPTKLSLSDEAHFGSRSLSELYEAYQNRLKTLNASDFGDLLLYNLEIFNKNGAILEEYQRQFKYILVDEYQDTNVGQYLWLRMLAQKTNNICCVGDDDQSIYGWRGAEVENILRFDRDFKDAKVIRLQQNYRSTNHILAAASYLIANNRERHGKTLWTEHKYGEKIKLSSFYDEKEEARYIADEIESLKINHKIPYSQMAVLVRAGYQTRNFEEAFNFLRIPYRVIGGLKFYERAEIKDVIAYMRLLINPSDSLAFERIVNVPKRGIGAATLQAMLFRAREKSISMFAAARELLVEGVIKGKIGANLESLINNFEKWARNLANYPHVEVIELMLSESGYFEMWKMEGTAEAKERLDNIKELLRGIEEFEGVGQFLEHISLVTDIDNLTNDEVVSIMTMHAAKGLEFTAVFLTGWEEGIFPSNKTIEENGNLGLEEERRLAYVGITRSKEKLYISFACNRRIFGSYQFSTPSRFINELPSENIHILNSFGGFGRSMSKPAVQEVYTIPKNLNQTESEAKFHKGKRVFHTKFGYGVIISIEDGSAHVAFEKSTARKILVEYLKSADEV